MLKAFHINDCETYAGHDIEEAVQAAMKQTGNPREEVLDDDAHEADPSERVRVDLEDPSAGWTTIGEILADMDEPGFVCGYDR